MKAALRSTMLAVVAGLRMGWLVVGVVLLVAVGLEFVARGVVREPSAGPAAFEVAATEWSPYVEYRTRAQRSPSLEVAPGGYRRTWAAEALTDEASTILCLGGDVLWGLGAVDEETIPSLLARRLADSGHDVRVVNQGQPGWIGTQEVLALILELRDGRVPDVVVFYDGIRDVQSAWRTGEAGQPLDHDLHVGWWKPAVRASDPPGVLYAEAARQLLRGSFDLLGGEEEPSDVKVIRRFPDAKALDEEALAEAIVEVYRSNLELVDGLAQAYGFSVLWYLEPSLFTGTPHAAAKDLQESLGSLGALLNEVHDLARELETRRGPTRFVDLEGLFEALGEPPFRSLCQLEADGREAVAARLAADLEPLLDALEAVR